MAWRVARSITKLFDQLNEVAPNRSKASDGTIGDAAHAQTNSDHNPRLIAGAGTTPVVTAGDFTHDPQHGADMAAISEALRRSRDRRIKYVIFNRRIFSATNTPWTWRTYSGASAHTEHMHVSVVGREPELDDQSQWTIGENDMEQSEKLAAQTGNASRTVGNVLADLSNLRDYLVSSTPPPASVFRPPAANSVIAQLLAAAQKMTTVATDVAALKATVALLAGKDLVDEEEIVKGVLAALTPEAIADAIPAELAEQVVAALGAKLTSG